MTGAPEVWFYHLERSRLEDALPLLLERALAAGWRAFVRSTETARLDFLDDHLWTFAEESFLPHGREDALSPERQPVLLGRSEIRANAAEALFLLDGADEPGDVAGVERVFVLFDGADTQAVAAERERWKALTAAGRAVAYWKQSPNGRWERAR